MTTAVSYSGSVCYVPQQEKLENKIYICNYLYSNIYLYLFCYFGLLVFLFCVWFALSD